MSGSMQSIPSVVLPLMPIGRIVLHFGIYFLVISSIAYFIVIGSLALLSFPNEVKTVDVPYVIIDT